MFPDTRIPSSDESTESRHRSQAQANPSNSGWDSSSDVGGGDQFEKIEGELVWLDSKVYQRYENKEAETLKGGQILPAGEKLIDKFPDGLCVARIGKKVLDLYPSNKNKCWTMCVYGLREHALHGSGTIALLGPQETLIELNSAIRANIVYNAAGRDLVRSGAIEGGQLPSIDKVAYVQNAPDDVNDIASWAHGKIAPSPLSGEVYSYRQEMQGSMQDSAGTFSLSNQGAADMKALGTATAVEASRDSAVGRMIPNRQLQAYMGTEWSAQVLDAERENYSPETFLESAEKSDEKGEMEYTERGVRAFFNSDSSMFLIEPLEGSWMPTTPAQDRANASEFATVASKITDPELLSTLAPSYGISYDINEWGAAQRNASMRLEEYSRVAEIVSKGGYPPDAEMVGVVLENIAEWAKVNPLMDDHKAFRDFYTDWFMSDEGRNADPLLRLVIQAVYGQHGEGIGVQAQELSAIKLKAQELEQKQQAEIAAKAQTDAQAIDEKAKQEADAKEAEAEQKGIVMELGKKAVEQDDAEFQSELKMAEKEHEARTEVAKAAAMAQVAPPAQ